MRYGLDAANRGIVGGSRPLARPPVAGHLLIGEGSSAGLVAVAQGGHIVGDAAELQGELALVRRAHDGVLRPGVNRRDVVRLRGDRRETDAAWIEEERCPQAADLLSVRVAAGEYLPVPWLEEPHGLVIEGLGQDDVIEGGRRAVEAQETPPRTQLERDHRLEAPDEGAVLSRELGE